MKNIYLLLVTLFICNVSFAQDSKFNVGAGLGFGLYGAKTNDNYAKEDTNAIDAASGITQIHFEYNIIERLAVGLKFERNGFMTEQESADKASSLNISICGRFNIVNGEKNLLYVELATGTSHFTYSNKSINKTDKVLSNGLNFQLGAGWSHYFGNHLGMNLSASMATYKYNKIIYTANDETLKVNNNQDDFTIKFSGMNMFAGLVFRF